MHSRVGEEEESERQDDSPKRPAPDPGSWLRWALGGVTTATLSGQGGEGPASGPHLGTPARVWLQVHPVRPFAVTTLVWGRRPSPSRGEARTPGPGSQGIPVSRGDAHICPEWTVLTRNTESGHKVSGHLLTHQGASPEVCSTTHTHWSPFLSSRKRGDETDAEDTGADRDSMGSGHRGGGQEPPAPFTPEAEGATYPPSRGESRFQVRGRQSCQAGSSEGTRGRELQRPGCFQGCLATLQRWIPLTYTTALRTLSAG